MRPGWRVESLCFNNREIEAVMFPPADPETRETKAEEVARVRTASKICSACSERVNCLEYAFLMRPEAGVWGGFSADAINRSLRNGKVLAIPLTSSGDTADEIGDER